MAIQRDNIHYTSRKIDGYQKPFNFVISEREAGKSTVLWLDKAYKAYKDGYTSIVLRRMINDITEAYISDCEKIIHKFTDDNIKIDYKKGNIKEGVVDVYIVDDTGRWPFVRIIALSNPVSRIKSLILPNLKYILFDEFICNPKFKEKYLPDEATRFKELYNTFQRESSCLKCYFFGNPYSHFNPYFLWLNVDTSKLKSGEIVSGINYVIECYTLTKELKELILSRNPLYQFDDSYKRYAFDGQAVNDMNIKLGELPDGYKLRFVFYMQERYIGVFKNDYAVDLEDRYFCKFVDNISARRNIYCFDFSELVNQTIMLSLEDRYKFNHFKMAMRSRMVAFSSIEVYYLIEEIYYNL